MPNRADLIMGLNQAMKGKNVDELGREYIEDTNTLKAGANGEVSVLVNKTDFSQIASGTVRYYVTDRRGIEEGNDLVFNEQEGGFKTTGHRVTKRVLSVKSYLDVPGLREGFSIISF